MKIVIAYHSFSLSLCNVHNGIPMFKKAVCLLKGTVRLLFQPAEEGGAGADHMIREGALGEAKAIFGMHVNFEVPTGSISVISGPACAAVSMFKARIEGKGGHAALPHTTTDPVVSASFIILALQQLISREADPLASHV